MESIDKIYQNALNNPMINIEHIWKEYFTFSSLQMDESSKEFQNMKKISREYENVTRPLERHLPALPPGSTGNDEEELRQINAWKRYVLWEKQNPLQLENQQDLIKRGQQCIFDFLTEILAIFNGRNYTKIIFSFLNFMISHILI